MFKTEINLTILFILIQLIYFKVFNVYNLTTSMYHDRIKLLNTTH